MVGYDFDKTIYAGDSSTDFFVFMLLHRPYLLLLMPYFCVVFLLYGTKVLSKKMTKQALFFYVPTHKNIGKLADKFWEKNIQKIYSFYKLQQKEDDIIISASLDFVFEPAMKLLGVKNYVSTKFDRNTGKIVGENCYGKAKVDAFVEKFGNVKLDAFYSDSLSDLPMMKMSKESYLTKNGVVKKLKIKNFDEVKNEKN